MPKNDCRYCSDYESSYSEISDEESYTCKKHKPKETCKRCCEKEKKPEKHCKRCCEKPKKQSRCCKKCDKSNHECDNEKSEIINSVDKKCGNYIIITLK